VVTAAASLADRTEQSLLQQHAAFVAGLPCDDQAKRLRRAGAERLLARHPDLQGWMGRPTADRIAEVRRLYAWPFLSWCFAIGAIRPDVELLAAKSKGLHYITWARMHPDQVARVAASAESMGWVAEWVYRVSTTALATVCMTRQTSLDEITLGDLAVVRADIAAAVACPAPMPGNPARAAAQPAHRLLPARCGRRATRARQRSTHQPRAADGCRSPAGRPRCVRSLPAHRLDDPAA
jgi:hypothetical protein